MSEIKTVGIKTLKNSLSAYLREVRRGTRILVSDRDRVVAEIHEPLANYQTESPDPVIGEWIREGILQPPGSPKTPLPKSPVRLMEGVAQQLLDEDRAEGHA